MKSKSKSRAKAAPSNSEPLVSIITAYYNTPSEFLREAVESVLAQTWSNWELLLWDDGSTTSIAELAHSFNDPRIVHKSSDLNRGLGWAGHNACLASRGDFIGWLDSDDYLAPNAIAAEMEVFQRRADVGLVASRCMQITPDGPKLDPRSSGPYSKELIETQHCLHHFRMWRRSAYLDCGGIDPSLRYATDFDLNRRLVQVASFDVVPEVLYYYRIHEGQVSQVKAEEQRNAFKHILQNKSLTIKDARVT